MSGNVEGAPYCRRKVMYSYDAAVRAHAQFSGGANAVAPHGYKPGLVIYHCPECGAYHLGHRRTA